MPPGTPARPSHRESLHRRPEARLDSIASDVPTIADDTATVTPDAIIGAAARAEDPAVEQRVARPADQCGVRRVEREQVRGPTGGEPASARSRHTPSPGRRPRAQHRIASGRWRRPSATRARCATGAAVAAQYSSVRSSTAASIITFESVPMPNRPPCDVYGSAGKIPSPRSDSVIGHRPTTAPRSMMPRISAASMCVA